MECKTAKICLSANQNDLIWWKRIKWTAVLGWMTCVHDMNSSNFIEIQKFWKVELKPHKRQHFAGQQETKLSQYPYIQLPASSIYECLQWPWLIGGTTKGKFCLMGLKRGWGEKDYDKWRKKEKIFLLSSPQRHYSASSVLFLRFLSPAMDHCTELTIV